MNHTEKMIGLIAAERERQKSVEGWTPEHDDEHTDDSLVRAAACYALPNQYLEFDRRVEAYAENGGRDCVYFIPKLWPWAEGWWKPKDRKSDLIRAGALIIAELERIERAEDPHK